MSTPQPLNERITSELLHELVPVIQSEGELPAGVSSRDVVAAKQRIYQAAYPLIVEIARKEFQRRQQWNSAATMDDLIQDGCVGLFKALTAFDVDAMGSSATHYLGQWILVSMRRGAESFDHDFQIGHDQGQKFRRIRAIRGRLSSELGREPSDEEVLAASKEHGQAYATSYLGKKSRTSSGAGLTAEDLSKERHYRERMGALTRLDDTYGDDDSPRFDAPSHEKGPADLLADIDAIEQLRALVVAVIRQMQCSPVEEDIIRRHYGLAPYQEPMSLRAVARELDINRDRVARTIRSFDEAMTSPGGVLFTLLNQMSTDDREALEVEWIWETLMPVAANDDDADVVGKEYTA